MTPTTFQQDHHQQNKTMKRENNNHYNGTSSSPLKVHRVSHAIKRSYSSSSSSTSKFLRSLVVSGSKDHQQQQRGPVIIYTHSPKVIHTNPRDFMALVQKLTGMSRSKDANVNTSLKNVPNDHTNQKMMMKMSGNDNNSSTTIDDNESSSVITDENCSSGTTGDVVGHLNPCMDAPLFDSHPALPQSPLVPGLPFFMNNNVSDPGQLCNSGDLPVYDYMNYNFPCYNQIIFQE